MKKKVLVMIMSMILLVTLCGCSAEELSAPINSTTVIVNADGSIKGVFIEDFSQPYYDSDELKTMVEQEIADYNNNKGTTGLTLDEYSVEGNTARVGITYASINDYEVYQKTELFLGTLNEAQAAGYDLDINLKSVTDGNTITAKDLLNQSPEQHILIMEEAPSVRVYKKALYCSEDVKSINAYELDASENAEMTYIVFK